MKRTFTLLIVLAFFSCTKNDGDDYLGKWYGEQYTDDPYNIIEIRKAGDKGYFVKLYHSNLSNEKTKYCFFKNGCYFYKDKKEIAFTCVNGENLILFNGTIYTRKESKEEIIGENIDELEF